MNMTWTLTFSTTRPPFLFSPEQIQQFLRHVYIYAEVLYSWELYHKRSELLKAIEKRRDRKEDVQHTIGA